MPLDIASLVAPISAAQPTGTYLRANDTGRALWAMVKEARQSARDAESRIRVPVDPEAPKPTTPEDLQGKIDRGWNTVRTKGETILREHSKDMAIAAWLTEALFRSDGFQGLYEGLTVCRQLCELYWDSLYPPADEIDVSEGILTTVAQLGGLGAALEIAIFQFQLTDTGRTMEDYVRAGTNQPKDPDQRQRAERSGMLTLDVLAAEGLKSKAERLSQKIKNLDDVVSEIYALKAVLDEKSGFNEDGVALTPNLGQLLELVIKVRDAVMFVRGAVPEPPPEAVTSAEGAPNEAVAQAGGGLVLTGGTGMNREAVFAELLRIADFFERSEPQSPVPHVLRQAVKWGRMQLPELLVELLGRGDTLNNVALRAGFKVPENNS